MSDKKILPKKHRAMRLPVSAPVLAGLLVSGSSWKVIEGIPETARVCGYTFDNFSSVIHLFLEHESFEEVDVNSDIVPILSTKFIRL